LRAVHVQEHVLQFTILPHILLNISLHHLPSYDFGPQFLAIARLREFHSIRRTIIRRLFLHQRRWC
jgi:hypothetical protein